MYSKVISLFLSLVLLIASLSAAIISVSAVDTTYVIAGDEALCGLDWVGDHIAASENIMTDMGDGIYQKIYTNVAVGEYQFKIVANSVEWYGDAFGNNLEFKVTSDCDVTVTFNSNTDVVSIDGDYAAAITGIEINYMTVVGNGDGNWLNGVNWDPADQTNRMAEISENIYQIKFTDIGKYEHLQFQFAANGSLANSWGGEFVGFGVESEAVYNSASNIVIDTTAYENCDITATIDLSNFDYPSKSGAMFRIDMDTQPAAETIVTTEEQTTEAQTVELPTLELPMPVTDVEDGTTKAVSADTPTAALIKNEKSSAEQTITTSVNKGAFLTVKATSNYFPELITKYDENTKRVTVSYYLHSSMDLLDTQWYMYYDPNVLVPAVDENGKNLNTRSSLCPVIGSNSGPINLSANGEYVGMKAIKFSASSLSLFDFSSKSQIFATAVFDVVSTKPVETSVNLYVDVIRVSVVDEDTGVTDFDKEIFLVNDGVINNDEAVSSVLVSRKTEATPPTYSEPNTFVTNIPEATSTAVQKQTTVKPSTVAEVTTVAQQTTVAQTDAKPVLTEPLTTEPSIVETTVDPVINELALTVNATSNYFPEATAQYNPKTKEVVVNYFIKSSMDMLDTQWYITYDPEILKVSDKNTAASVFPAADGKGTVLKSDIYYEDVGYIEFSAASLSLFDISSAKTPFATLIFDVKDIADISPIATTVDLVVEVLRVSEIDKNGQNIPGREILLVDDQKVLNNSNTDNVKVEFDTMLTPSNYVEPVTEATEATEATEVTDATTATNVHGQTEPASDFVAASTDDITVDIVEPVSDAASSTEKNFGNASSDDSSTDDNVSTPDNSASSNGLVQTGEAPLAIIILVLLIGATCVLFVLHKKEMYN